MLSYEAADEIIENRPWLKKHRKDLETVIIAEASYWQQYAHEHGELGDFPAAVEKAFKTIGQWFDEADSYEVDVLDLEDLANFVAHYRSACVWTILIRRDYRINHLAK